MRLVLDTNVAVAGLLWSGPPRRLIELAFEGEAVELFSTPALLDELRRTLGYRKFAARIERFGASVPALVDQYAAIVSIIIPAAVPRVVIADADDDHVIAAAIAAKAELIVSGDRHLLSISRYQDIAIVEAAEALRRIRA